MAEPRKLSCKRLYKHFYTNLTDFGVKYDRQLPPTPGRPFQVTLWERTFDFPRGTSRCLVGGTVWYTTPQFELYTLDIFTLEPKLIEKVEKDHKRHANEVSHRLYVNVALDRKGKEFVVVSTYLTTSRVKLITFNEDGSNRQEMTISLRPTYGNSTFEYIRSCPGVSCFKVSDVGSSGCFVLVDWSRRSYLVIFEGGYFGGCVQLLEVADKSYYIVWLEISSELVYFVYDPLTQVVRRHMVNSVKCSSTNSSSQAANDFHLRNAKEASRAGLAVCLRNQKVYRVPPILSSCRTLAGGTIATWLCGLVAGRSVKHCAFRITYDYVKQGLDFKSLNLTTFYHEAGKQKGAHAEILPLELDYTAAGRVITAEGIFIRI